MLASAALAPLRRRDFRLLLGGQTISWIGNSFYEIAIMWLVLKLTGSTAAMAGVAAVSAIPQLIFAPLAGVVADRVNRRVMALSMDLCRGVVILVLPTLALIHHLAAWQVYVVGFVLFTLFTFFIPARQAILPNLVPDEELSAANALFQSVLTGSFFIGFALGGIVLAAIGVIPALYLDALTFVGSVVSLLLMHSSGRSAMVAPAERHSALAEAASGLRFIRNQPSLLAIFGFSGVVGLLVGPLIVLPAPFSSSILHAGPRGYGFLEASFMFGNFLGALMAGFSSRIRQVGWLLILVSVICGVLLFGMSFATVLWAATPFYLCVGLATGAIEVPLITLIQRLTPDEMRGRVMSTMMMVNTAGLPLSLAAGGVGAQSIGVTAVYRIVGILFASVGLLGIVTPLVRVQSAPPRVAPLTEDIRRLSESSDPAPA